MLTSIFSAGTSAAGMTLLQFFSCTAASILAGTACALIYMFRNRYRKDFVITLALLPMIVQMIIMLVNGNLGAGVAVMGAFSLVRFRSVPGSAKDIGSIFCAMALGLATGMGYLTTAAVFIVCFSVFSLTLNFCRFGEKSSIQKQLRITIPEDLDYNGIFDDIFEQYTEKHSLSQVKTTNMGSLFELSYLINLKEDCIEKEFIDLLRCRNGNLKIVCGKVPENQDFI